MTNNNGSIEEARPEIFILKDFWPILKTFQILGFFPLKKIVNDNGTIHLQPMKISLTLIILSIWWLVTHAPPVALFFYLKDRDKYKSISTFACFLKAVQLC